MNVIYVFKETTDKKKYDFAKKIPIHIIRDQYQNDWDSDIKKIRQRGVILYIIDMVSCTCIWAMVDLFEGITIKNRIIHVHQRYLSFHRKQDL